MCGCKDGKVGEVAVIHLGLPRYIVAHMAKRVIHSAPKAAAWRTSLMAEMQRGAGMVGVRRSESAAVCVEV